MGLDWCTRRVQFVFSFTIISFTYTERWIISKEGGNVVEIWEKEDSTCFEFYINSADTEHPDYTVHLHLSQTIEIASSWSPPINLYNARFFFFFFVHKILSFDLHEEFNILSKRSLRRSFVERCKYYWRK